MSILNFDNQTLIKLGHLTGSVHFHFLGFIISLDDCSIVDTLNPYAQTLSDELAVKLIAPMLNHYTLSKPTALTGNLVKFRDLPGGYAYEGAFINRAIKPLEWHFNENPFLLSKAAELLGGQRLNIGDDSTEILVLDGISLTFILYGSDEFGASVNILYDKSAVKCLPTEDLAVLGELVTLRLIDAKHWYLQQLV
ncbi:MAG: DUF3786 domain-containing protein [Nitrososphaerota archaeon]|nr:DUF3786 domain-containing protein [Nitrososphaerota archaeon]